MSGYSNIKPHSRPLGIPRVLMNAAQSAYATPSKPAPVSLSLREALGSGKSSSSAFSPPAGLTPKAAALTSAGRGQLDIAGLLQQLKSLQAPAAPPAQAQTMGMGGPAGGPQGASGQQGAPQGTGRVPPGRANGLIVSLARRYGVDPAAALAVASMEGLGGGIGDGGTSFGAWQLHKGGALPSNIGRLSSAQAQAWAWSPAGIEYAIRQIAKVSRGLHGRAAIENIVRRFERPANPDREVAGATRAYGRYR